MKSKNIKQQTFDFTVEKNSKGIDLDFSKPVGDPMVEIGRLGLVEFCGKDRFDGFEELKINLQKIFKIYLEKLISSPGTKSNQKNGLTMFWLNNPISYGKNIEKAILKIEEALESENIGNCSCCGREYPLTNADRTIYPLGFSNTNMNFGSSFSDGIKICPICYISLYTMPLNSQKVAGRVGFLIGNCDVNRYWSKLNNRYINKIQVDIREHDLINSNIDYFENFIYWHIGKLSSKEIDFENISFYIFSNMGSEVSIDIVNISSNLIRFLHTFSTIAFGDKLRLEHKKIWNSLIAKHFNFLTYKNNIELIKKEKKNKETIETVLRLKQAIKKEKNRLISKFIRNENIFYFMKDDFKKEYEKFTDISLRLKYSKAYSSLIFKYLKEVQGMNKERLDFLKELAKKIAESGNGEKFLGKLGRCKWASDFRMLLIQELKSYKKDEKLFTTDDFVYKIFPKDEYFGETRDILIVAMYEFLDRKQLNEEIIIEKIGDDNE